VPLPDCLPAAHGTLNVIANGAAPPPPDAGFIVDREAMVKVSEYAAKFDLTIPPQPSVPLSGQLSVDYERITVDKTDKIGFGPSSCK
jgi:hypothetical protein